MSTGLGGDMFAMVWKDDELVRLDAAGPALAGADADEPVADRGPTSTSTPAGIRNAMWKG
jgi:gamma-glutamyltranspeptidase